MPGRVRARVAMQQQDGWPGASMAHRDGYVADVDAVECESLEHRLKLTVRPVRQFIRPGRSPAIASWATPGSDLDNADQDQDDDDDHGDADDPDATISGHGTSGSISPP